MPRVSHTIVLFALAALLSSAALAAGNAGEKAPDFPPGLFIDGRPYSMKDLEGKAVVLFFYEQDCPKCRGEIPNRNAIVKQFEGKPVRFIAIAAGDSMAEARAYVAATKLAMPVFADNLSLMEGRYGTKISLKNIWQFRVIGPDGVVSGYRFEPAEIEKAVAKAKWKYKELVTANDPRLLGAVEALEWGQYASGIVSLKPMLKSAKKDVADSAKKVYEAVQAEGQQWLADAEKAAGAEQAVEAYDLYTKVSQAFAGEELGKKAAEALKKLSQDKAVKDELAARAMFNQLNQGAAKAAPNQREAVAGFAASIAKKYPATPTGQRAEALAKEIAGTGE